MNYTHLKRGVQTAKRQPASPARQMKGIVDRRPEFAAQRKLIAGIQNSSGVAQCSLEIGGVKYTSVDGVKKLAGLVPWDDRWNYFVNYMITSKNPYEYVNFVDFIENVGTRQVGENIKDVKECVDWIWEELNTDWTDDKIKVLEEAKKPVAKDSLSKYWNLIVNCRKIIWQEADHTTLVELKKQLFILEVRLARALSIIDDGLLPKTTQASKTYMCWFLSVFEGLRRAGLVYPILDMLRNFGNIPFATPLERWQKTLKWYFLSDRYEGMPQINDQTPRPTNNERMKAFFRTVLSEFDYKIEDVTIEKSMSVKNRLDVLKEMPIEGGVQVSKDAKETSFYTVDKPGHAMFYLGGYSYDEKKEVNSEIKEKERKLALINKGQWNEINVSPQLIGLKGLEKVNKKRELEDKAAKSLNDELDKIRLIPLTGWGIRVYNQSHQAEETYRFGEMERIQKHTFTLK